MKIMINMIIMIIIARFTIITNRDFEDEGPLSLPVTDREFQRQAESQILRSVSQDIAYSNIQFQKTAFPSYLRLIDQLLVGRQDTM